MRLVTLGQMRADTKMFANMRSSAFVSDAEVDRQINQSLAELWEMLVTSRGHEYACQVASLATTPGSAVLALPADHFEVLYVGLNWGSNQLEEVPALDHIGDQIGYREWGQWTQWSPKAFRERGQLIEFFPTPTAVTTVELRYLPASPVLVGDAATIDDVDGWSKLVSLRSAMELLILQNLPTTGVERLYEREKERVEGLAAKRAAAHPSSIRDVRFGMDNGRGNWWRRRRLPPPP
jgi:hypothetical protein